MLRELRVRNLAVIEDARVTLGPGLNVLTGETGAGKSMLVDALSLLLGERASVDMIRSGASRAVVEAEFEGVTGQVGSLCDEAGVELDDGRLIVRRELNQSGRNRAWAGGGPATLGVLTSVGECLVDLHGQHETQSLLRAGAQREILDEFADARQALNEVRAAHAKLRDAEARRSQLMEKLEDVKRRVDYLRHVSGEIAEAMLQEGEEEALEIESRRLANVEDLTNAGTALIEALDESETSALAALAVAARCIRDLARIDDTVSPWRDSLESTVAELEELVRTARDYLSDIETDPERLRHVEARRDLIYRLKQKYGPAVSDVLEQGRQAAAEVELLDTAELDISQLEGECERLAAELSAAGDRLTAVRREAGLRLSDRVTALLPELGLRDGRFVVELEPRGETTASGAEDVVFTVRLNPGLPARPLAKVASGGELSRLMLAVKVVLAEQDAIPTLIFDEVDQGIGGEVANSVAAALAEVGKKRQVLVITHLAQIAARAQHHLLISKSPDGGIARAVVRELDGGDRVDEVARMLGGAADGVVREHARELLGRRKRAG